MDWHGESTTTSALVSAISFDADSLEIALYAEANCDSDPITTWGSYWDSPSLHLHMSEALVIPVYDKVIICNYVSPGSSDEFIDRCRYANSSDITPAYYYGSSSSSSSCMRPADFLTSLGAEIPSEATTPTGTYYSVAGRFSCDLVVIAALVLILA